MKKFVVGCLFLVVCSLANGQSEATLPGKYVLILGPAEQIRITLTKKNKFVVRSYPYDGGKAQISKGEWKLNKDTLVLISEKKIEPCGTNTVKYVMALERFHSAKGCHEESYFRKVKKFPPRYTKSD